MDCVKTKFGTVIFTMSKATRPGGAAGSLFDAPSEPSLGNLFDLHFHAPKPSSVKVPHITTARVRKPKSIKTPSQSMTLFDDSVHPRAGEGAEHFNPETGKTSKGGQFAHNPLKQGGNDGLGAGVGQSAEESEGGLERDSVPGSTEESSATGAGIGGVGEAPGGDSAASTAGVGDGGTSGAGAGRGAAPGTEGRGTGVSDDPRHGAGTEPEQSGQLLDISAPLVPAWDGEGGTDGRIDAEQAFVAGLRSVSAPVKTGYDFRITDADNIGKGGPKSKYADNLAAIKLLKTLEGEQRNATPEEQGVLAKYSGWGWASGIFNVSNHGVWNNKDGGNSWLRNYYKPNDWYPQYEELRGVLTPDEWDAAAESTQNAHFTAPKVVEAMWAAVQHMGFKGGNVLEPACGSGNFFGLMPSDLAAVSSLTGVEKDSLTARIAAQLYQNGNIQHCGFEESQTPGGFYDLAISNVPFGNITMFDPAYNTLGKRFLLQRIHNYFFAKSMDKLKPGGLMAFITSTGTMDARTSSDVREYLNEQADFVGAMRLPNDAFKENAGTEVTTDVIFLRKRVPGEPPSGHEWTNSLMHDLPEGQGFINEYYHAHPEMMLGTPATTTLYGGGVKDTENLRAGLASDGRDINEAMKGAISGLPENIMAESGQNTPATMPDAEQMAMPKPGETQVNQFVVKDGKLCVLKQFGPAHLGQFTYDETGIDPNSKKGKRIVGMLSINDHALRLLNSMAKSETSDDKVSALQFVLGKAYDNYVKDNGHFHDRENFRLMHLDPAYSLMLALEDYDSTTKQVMKARLFTERTNTPRQQVTKADSPHDAMLVSLSENNRLDFDRMAQLLPGRTADDIRDELSGSGHIFHNPTGAWERSDLYLSGNVRDKLKTAQAAALADPRYQANAEALEKVQPTPLTPGQIDVKLGASWVPDHVVADFMHHMLNVNGSQDFGKVTYIPGLAQWVIDPPSKYSLMGAANTSTFGTSRRSAIDLLDGMLNLKEPMVYDPDPMDRDKRIFNPTATQAAREKTQAIADEFQRWIWHDGPRTDMLVEKYNDVFGGQRLRQFDGSHLTLPGMSEFGRKNLNSHVKNGVFRHLQTPNVGTFKAVGAGKTWELAASAMEMRRMGLRKKVMITVPNHLVAQWGKEVADIYPGAKVLMATPEDFEKSKRRELLARIATGDYDLIITPHSSFNMIPVSPEREKAYYTEQIRALDDMLRDMPSDGKKSRTAKQIEAQKNNLKVKLKNKIEKRKDLTDNWMHWEQLGVDHLMVDEAHEYKNLWFPSKIGTIKGLPRTDSSKSLGMLLKARAVQEKSGGGGLTMATGTPVANSIAELWVMQHYLDPETQKKTGVHHFDAWAQNFGKKASTIEATVTGKWKKTTRFSKWSNMPELAMQLHNYADVLTSDQLTTVKPTPERVAVPSPMSDFQLDYLKQIERRGDALTGPASERPDPSEDNFLKLTSDGRKNSLDPRLIDPSAPEHGESKMHQCANMVAKEYHAEADLDEEGKRRNASQLVFLDLGTPKAAANVNDAADAENADAGYSPAIKSYVDDLQGPLRSWGEKVMAWHEGGCDDDEPENPGKDLDEQEKFNEVTHMIASISEQENSDDGMRDSLYHDLRKKLIARGIPAHEIAFAHDYTKPADKLALQSAVSDGKVRVLLGSTKKMGTGMNVQHRMCALHHLDCPWRPCDLEQRDGRIIRKGNKNKHVRVYSYVGEGVGASPSFDAVLWQLIESKSRAIDAIMKGDPNVRTSDDIGDCTINAATLKSIASGNPLVQERIDAEQKMIELASSARAHQDALYQAQKKLSGIPAMMTHVQGHIDRTAEAIAHRDAHKDGGLSVGGQKFDKLKDGMEALSQKALDRGTLMVPSDKPEVIGKYKGFELYSAPFTERKFDGPSGARTETRNAIFMAKTADGGHSGKEWSTMLGAADQPGAVGYNLSRDLNSLDADKERHEKNLAQHQSDKELYEKVPHDFPRQSELQLLRDRMDSIDKELDSGGDDVLMGDKEADDDGIPSDDGMKRIRKSFALRMERLRLNGGFEDASPLEKAFGSPGMTPELHEVKEKFGVRHTGSTPVGNPLDHIKEFHHNVEAANPDAAGFNIGHHFAKQGYSVNHTIGHDGAHHVQVTSPLEHGHTQTFHINQMKFAPSGQAPKIRGSVAFTGGAASFAHTAGKITGRAASGFQRAGNNVHSAFHEAGVRNRAALDKVGYGIGRATSALRSVGSGFKSGFESGHAAGQAANLPNSGAPGKADSGAPSGASAGAPPRTEHPKGLGGYTGGSGPAASPAAAPQKTAQAGVPGKADYRHHPSGSDLNASHFGVAHFDTRSRWEGKKGQQTAHFSHLMTANNPARAIREFHQRVAGQHQTTDLKYNRVNVAGVTKHVYKFQYHDGKALHTVSVMRPATQHPGGKMDWNKPGKAGANA